MGAANTSECFPLYSAVTGAAARLTGSDSGSCLSQCSRGHVPSAVIPPRHAVTRPFACITAVHLPSEVQGSTPRERPLHKVSASLLILDREVAFKIHRPWKVVGLIWDFCLRCNIQPGCSSTVTVMHPSNKFLKLKLFVVLGSLTLCPFHQTGGCWSDSVTYHAWCSVLLIIVHCTFHTF